MTSYGKRYENGRFRIRKFLGNEEAGTVKRGVNSAELPA